MSDQELEKCKKKCIIFKGTDISIEMLDHVLQLKGGSKRVNKKLFDKTYTYWFFMDLVFIYM